MSLVCSLRLGVDGPTILDRLSRLANSNKALNWEQTTKECIEKMYSFEIRRDHNRQFFFKNVQPLTSILRYEANAGSPKVYQLNSQTNFDCRCLQFTKVLTSLSKLPDPRQRIREADHDLWHGREEHGEDQPEGGQEKSGWGWRVRVPDLQRQSLHLIRKYFRSPSTIFPRL